MTVADATSLPGTAADALRLHTETESVNS